MQIHHTTLDRHASRRRWVARSLAILLVLGALTGPASAADAPLVRSVRSGPWSAAETWKDGQVPGAGARVQVCTGHTVVYDVKSEQTIRLIHVAGTLSFARDRDTLLTVGLIKVQPGDDASEDGFDCEAHISAIDPSKPRATLEVGAPNQPLDAKHSALIRLVYIDGMNKESCPAIVCCGGRMDFHGAPMNRTWIKLDATAKVGDTQLTLTEAATGWRVGDRIILTATTRQVKLKKTFQPTLRTGYQTEERIIKAIEGAKLTLDQPLVYEHLASGDYRCEAANLSRNVTVESAKPDGVRGHTMYHRYSAGSISYAEFRHLGKEDVLGRYSLHYHLVGDSMRGSSVIGASIWDSHNRWITIHGTNYLVVRDCVGYKSVGHGYFMEDGTEVYNVLDRNLAVLAFNGKPLPKQVLPYDKNDGSGFWWANSLNSFTRNVAAECDEYGYFFQAPKTADFDPELIIQQADGSKKKVDIRTLPFVRFEDNEAHCQRRHAFNLGGGVPFGKPDVGGVGPDARHPFVIRNLKVWNIHWALHPVSPSVLVDNMDIFNAQYGIWRPVYNRHAYRSVKFNTVPQEFLYAFAGNKPPNADDAYPKPLDPIDDLAPVTIITHVRAIDANTLLVRGTTTDNGTVKKVLVNGQEARALTPNFAEWEMVLVNPKAGEDKVKAHAEDAAGNLEKRPHVWILSQQK